MGEVRYGKATLPECCRRIGERQEEPYKESLCSIYQRMEANHGESFQTVFCEQMSACLEKMPVTKQDKEDFLLFASGNSFEEGQMQIRTIERSKELLQSACQEVEKENKEKCRMAVGLGAMSGLLLVIILL